MLWTDLMARTFAGGCIIGAFVVLVLAIIVCSHILDKHEKYYSDKYTTVAKERNDLLRQNKKLIDFIKNKKWVYDHDTRKDS